MYLCIRKYRDIYEIINCSNLNSFPFVNKEEWKILTNDNQNFYDKSHFSFKFNQKK